MNYGELTVQVSGGLGNQMFQYAAARGLALEFNKKLIVDAGSAFKRDRVYNRTFALQRFDLKATVLEKDSLGPYLAYKLHRTFRGDFPGVTHGCFFNFISEMFPSEGLKYLPNLQLLQGRDYCMFGYWQSENYFKSYASQIRSELQLPMPDTKKVRDLGSSMGENDSVAVGIRLYEESPNPMAHSSNGAGLDLKRLRGLLTTLHRESTSRSFYVFCTHKPAFFDELFYGLDVHYVIPEFGYSDELEALWLFSQCKSHVITNSSFYWWGAWLASDLSKVVYAQDNFINKDSIPADWVRF